MRVQSAFCKRLLPLVLSLAFPAAVLAGRCTGSSLCSVYIVRDAPIAITVARAAFVGSPNLNETRKYAPKEFRKTNNATSRKDD
jgi:hypothetical protein